MMANLVADSGCNKGQFTNISEAMCRDFRSHDEDELAKLVDSATGLGEGEGIGLIRA